MKVGIHIKTGPPSSKSSEVIIQELEVLHDKTAIVDMNNTWEEEILHHFGIEIDTSRYYVRRVRSTRGEPPHSLQSKIGDLMAEFLMLKKLQSVQIMEFDHVVTLDMVSKKGIKSSSPLVRKGLNVKTKVKGSAGQVKRQMGLVQRPTGQERRPPGQVERPGGQEGGYVEVVDVEVEDNVHTGKKMDGGGGNKRVQQIGRTEEETRNARKRLKVDGVGEGRTIWQRRPVPLPPPRRRMPKKTFSSDPDAFKILFYERAKHSLTNDVLLKARHDLQQLKASSTPGNNNHWMKWLLASPLPSSILRTLFDV